MLKRLTNIAVVVCALLIATSAAMPSPQETKEKQPKDQAEYELINKAFKETNPQTKLQLLSEWQEKYPESDYKDDRLRLFMRTHQAAGDKDKTLATAKDVLEQHPGDFEANFTIAGMIPTLGKTDPATLKDGAEAAEALLKGKPSTLTDEQWNQVKNQVLLTAHQTLGWIHMQKKENVPAEKEFKEVLALNPNLAQVSYWLGNVVLAQGDPDKNELALFSFARASSYTGEGSLNEQGRKQVDEYFTKVYKKYAGDNTDAEIAQLKEQAKTQALPPATLKIKPKDLREFEADQAARKASPLLYVFLDLKDQLVGAQGDQIWSDLHGKLTPKMQLYVVGSDSARPSVISLSSKQGGPAEVVLNLENRLRAAPGNGSKVTFEGVASDLSKSPFKLTLTGGHVL